MGRFFAFPGRMEGTPEAKRRAGKGGAGEDKTQMQAQWIRVGMAAAFTVKQWTVV